MGKKKDLKIELLSKVLRELESPDNFPVWIVIVEVKKLTDGLKMLLAHIYDRDHLEYQASVTASIDESDQKWVQQKVGASEYCVVTFSGREKNFFEKLKDFISRSFTEGKLQDFWPL